GLPNFRRPAVAPCGSVGRPATTEAPAPCLFSLSPLLLVFDTLPSRAQLRVGCGRKPRNTFAAPRSCRHVDGFAQFVTQSLQAMVLGDTLRQPFGVVLPPFRLRGELLDSFSHQIETALTDDPRATVRKDSVGIDRERN